MCDQCGMYRLTGPYAYREGNVPRVGMVIKEKPKMGRIIDAMLKNENHEPELGWSPTCHGCKHATYRLLRNFDWMFGYLCLGKRGSVIPYDPRFDNHGYDRRNNDGK